MIMSHAMLSVRKIILFHMHRNGMVMWLIEIE